MLLVEYYHNNSFGRDWLTDQDWQNLERAGWELEQNSWSSPPRYMYAKKRFESMEQAITEWEEITNEFARECGCPCCGPPHNFSANDEKTNEWYYMNHYCPDDDY